MFLHNILKHFVLHKIIINTILIVLSISLYSRDYMNI